MTKTEAEAVIKVLLLADSGCEACVSNLLKLFVLEFPRWRVIVQEAYLAKFNEEIELG